MLWQLTTTASATPPWTTRPHGGAACHQPERAPPQPHRPQRARRPAARPAARRCCCLARARSRTSPKPGSSFEAWLRQRDHDRRRPLIEAWFEHQCRRRHRTRTRASRYRHCRHRQRTGVRGRPSFLAARSPKKVVRDGAQPESHSHRRRHGSVLLGTLQVAETPPRRTVDDDVRCHRDDHTRISSLSSVRSGACTTALSRAERVSLPLKVHDDSQKKASVGAKRAWR